jgi:hypothetical protein
VQLGALHIELAEIYRMNPADFEAAVRRLVPHSYPSGTHTQKLALHKGAAALQSH